MKQLKMKRKKYLKLRQDLYEFLSQIGTISESMNPGDPLFEAYRKASDALDEFEQYGIELGYLDINNPVVDKVFRKR